MDFITAADPEVGRAIQAEYDRQQQNIELIASENVVSSAVLAAAGTVLTNKYAEGYPGKRYYGGCQCVDVVEDIAIQRARQLFGAGFANVQPHSGAQANYAVYQALCQYGDTVLGMSLDNGGHLTPPSSPAPRAAPWSTSSPPRRWRWAKHSGRNLRPISSRSSKTLPSWQSPLWRAAWTWSPAARTTT